MAKVALITCYKKQDYVRASTLAKAIADNKNHTLVVVKNQMRGIGRYAEVIFKLIRVRITEKPDVYLLTFRGYEMLLPVRLIAAGKPLIFDEFINAEEWLLENSKVSKNSFLHKIFHVFYSACLRLPKIILADTKSHADYSARISRVDRNKYSVVQLSSDENIFKPTPQKTGKIFEVFYYSSESQPLHGIEHVCDAAVELASHPSIHFTLIGPGRMKELAEAAIQNNANITYIERVPYKDIAGYVHVADVCLAGPFGNTLQSQYVITGKAYQFMAAKRPMIIGKNKETSVYFKHQTNCILVEQGSTGALVDAIKWAHEHPAELEKIAREAYRKYQTHFSNDRLNEQVSLLIDRAISAKVFV